MGFIVAFALITSILREMWKAKVVSSRLQEIIGTQHKNKKAAPSFQFDILTATPLFQTIVSKFILKAPEGLLLFLPLSIGTERDRTGESAGARWTWCDAAKVNSKQSRHPREMSAILCNC